MTLIVEDGSGIYEANAYAGRGFVSNYLMSRGRAETWIASSEEAQIAAIIAATDYIDRRFGSVFLGEKLYEDLTVYASNILQIAELPVDGDTITIGAVTYTFRNTAAVAFDVAIGTTIGEAVGALVAAVAGTGGGMGTTAHPSASADVLTGVGDVIVQALVAGVLAAAIPTTSSNPKLIWDYSELIGGLDEAEQVLEFPRTVFTGIPIALKQAVAEYAERALAGALMPDPEVDATGGLLILNRDKVGPIESEQRYSGGIIQIFKKYPTADRLLLGLISSGGGVIR